MNYLLSFLATGLLLAQIACSSRTSDVKEMDNQGVHIYYTDSKNGDTTLLFVHGWGINHSYWSNQETYFSKRYRVVTLDLPGYGSSGKNRSSWNADTYTKDLAVLLTGLNLQHVVLIGHSMAGAIVVETAVKYPAHILAVVGIDNLKDIGTLPSPEMKKEWAAFYASARKDFKATVSKSIAQLFAPSTDSLIQKRVSQDILSSDPSIAIASLENLDGYPFTEKLKSMKASLYLINSDYVPTDTLAFKKEGIDYHLLSVGTTGHYPMLEQAEVFNAQLSEVLEDLRIKK